MARVRRNFKRKIQEIENEWIPMPDSTQLACRIWLPQDAMEKPVPAVLEFIPYRKRDFTRLGDALHHRYLAGHGYAAVRCDLRGNGDSEGLFDDEYSSQELDDGYHVVEWLAAQPWCSGRVGMMGISWGGFNCLQVAALRPPSLKAIYSVCSTDDRYSDDVHYMGGCLLNHNMMWGSTMTTFAMRPPDPEIVGERWREMWMQRLHNLPNLVANWMRHQRRDAFWKHGSVCENYHAIEVPVYAVGGWADGYTNTVPRLMANLRSPRRGLIGPWAHTYPWKGTPKPDIDGLHDLVRWWDHWLKGIDTAMMDEPMLRVWMQDSVAPATMYSHRPGRWVGEAVWPNPSIRDTTYHLNGDATLGSTPKRSATVKVKSEQITGHTHGDWCPYGYESEMPSDQREEDGRSVCFDTDVLGRSVEVLGTPRLSLELSSDSPQTLVYVRLCDVAPDGASTRVSFGLLNLSHLAGHENPRALEPGKIYDVDIRLNDIAHRFAKGHRIRVAIATCAWTLVWPSPQGATLDLRTASSTLTLPVRPKQSADNRLRSLGAAVTASPSPAKQLRAYHRSRRDSRDHASGETIVEMVKDRGCHYLEDIDLTISGRGEERYTLLNDDPLSARADVRYAITIRRDEHYDTRVETRFILTSTASEFHLTACAEAYDGTQRVFVKQWTDIIPRDHV